MKSTGVIACWLLLVWAAAAQTNQTCYRYPVRVFGPRSAVTLSPLFQWWAHQPVVAGTNEPAATVDADRPLTAWQRVTGTKVAIVGSSWVLNAVVYSSPSVSTNARVILNHPPDAEEQIYYGLKAQLAAAGQQIAQAQRVYAADTNAELKAQARVKAYLHADSRVAVTGIYQNSRVEGREHQAAVMEGREHQAAVNDLKQVEQLEAARDRIEQQLKLMPARDGVYLVDWFAVEIGRTKQGVPIYDVGLLGGAP